MIYTIVGAGAVGAGDASRYGSGSDQKMRLLAAPAPQHCTDYRRIQVISQNCHTYVTGRCKIMIYCTSLLSIVVCGMGLYWLALFIES
jgi:hypothetical protein